MIQWIFTSSLLILAVIVLRCLGRERLSARVRYALWLLVLVRLLVPFSVGSSPISVMNWMADAPHPVTMGSPDIYDLPDSSEAVGTYDSSDTTVTTQTVTATNPTVEPRTITGTAALDILWFAGCAMTGAILLSCNLRLDAALKRSRRAVHGTDCRLPVYETAVVETPCMFGLLRPAVYIIPELTDDPAALRHVLAHEQTHYRHWDHIWSLLRCVCLSIHWYNPLVWVAAYLSREDAELACDEGTLGHMDETERTAYGETLIALTCTGHSGLMTTATTMTGSHRGLKERIKRIADRRNASVIAMLAVIILAIPLTIALLTGQSEHRGVEGVWRSPSTVLGVGQEDNDQTDNWLEYEFSDGTGCERHIVSGQVRYEEEFSYTLQGNTLSLSYVTSGSGLEFSLECKGDTLTLTDKSGTRSIVLTRYQTVDGHYTATVRTEGGHTLISTLTLSDGQYSLSEPLYSSFFNGGTYTVEGDIITCTSFGDRYVYRFQLKNGNMVYLAEDSDPISAHGTLEDAEAMTMRQYVDDGAVFKYTGEISTPTAIHTPGAALASISVDTPGLTLTLSVGTDPLLMQEICRFGDVHTANNAEHFLEYALKLYRWTPIAYDSAEYTQPRHAVSLSTDTWKLVAYADEKLVWFECTNGSGWYAATEVDDFAPYRALRGWYDELEYAAIHREPVIPNKGQTPSQAAQQFVEQSDAAYLQVSSGSKFRFTFVQSTVVDGDFVEQMTEQMRKNGELGDNEYCFYVETVFVPETEYAWGHNMAGNTVEYTGNAPGVPAGAWQRTACGIISLESDGWHGRIVGTSW